MTYVPWGELATNDFEKADVLLKGIPWDCAASAGKGAAEAPDRIDSYRRYFHRSRNPELLWIGLFIKDEEILMWI